jgi:hypothetical protein
MAREGTGRDGGDCPNEWAVTDDRVASGGCRRDVDGAGWPVLPGSSGPPRTPPGGNEIPLAEGHSALRSSCAGGETSACDERRRGRPAFVLFLRPASGGALELGGGSGRAGGRLQVVVFAGVDRQFVAEIGVGDGD